MRDPGVTYEEVRDRVITRQPEFLARYREERRRPYVPAVPDPADEVIVGKTREHFDVEKGVQSAPSAPGVKRRRRIWCSVCLGYWTPQEKKSGSHTHRDAAPLLPRQRKKRKPRRQWWKTEGAAGGYSMLAPDPRIKREAHHEVQPEET